MIGIINEPAPFPGRVEEVNGTGITVQFAGRLGVLKVPWRLVLSENPVKVGEKVMIMMSLVEVEN